MTFRNERQAYFALANQPDPASWTRPAPRRHRRQKQQRHNGNCCDNRRMSRLRCGVDVKRQRGRKWMYRRARHLRLHPLCAHCIKRGTVKAAEEVDHIIALANGGQDADNNLQSLCKDCHAVKTAQDMGYTQRNTIGIDGWPVSGGGVE